MLGLLTAARSAPAAELGDPGALLTLDVHGFVSQGFIASTANDYLVKSSQGSFEYSEAALNFTSQLTDRLRIGVQFFAYDLGTLGNYNLRADWFYLDYRIRDSLGIRAGRVKLPFGLYSDIADIDAARTPVLLPQSLYPQSNRYFLLGVTGGELYGFLDLDRAGALDYAAVGGAIPIEVPVQIGQPEQASSIDIPYLASGRVMWETPLTGLRIGVSGLVLKLNEGVVFPGSPTLPMLNIKDVIYAAIGSLEYVGHDLLLAAEYGQARSVIHDDQPSLFPEGATVDEGGYGLVAYRVAPWLQPSAYYSFYHPNRNVWSGRRNFQDDLAFTLRFDVNSFWIVKLEGHYMRGTAALPTSPTQDPNVAPENWGLFLVKTTAYF